MWEVLNARTKDIAKEFEQNFVGMTTEPVTLKDLLDARSRLIDVIVGGMPEERWRFLVSSEKGDAQWDLLGLPKIDKLPAVRWRQQNLDKITKNKRADLVIQLEKVLGLDVTPAQLTLIAERSAPSKKRTRRKPEKSS